MAALTGADARLPLIIFGDRLMASLVWHCVTRDTERQVVGFCVEASHLSRDRHEGLPVVAFEELEEIFPPGAHELMIPSAAANADGARRRLCEAARRKGYRLASHVSSQASVWPDASLGEHCLIFERAVLQSFASLGRDVIVRSGANIGHHSVVGDHCFIATGVVTGGNVTIGEQCFVGLGAVLRDGIQVAPRCLIGAGAVLLTDTQPNGIYVGNPARRSMAKLAFERSEPLVEPVPS